ncbi:MAG: aminotransferase class IV [Alphaproteobacteria bacterium]|nr:aminotransferase class IV [Alphaproteobacteria bacterium]
MPYVFINNKLLDSEKATISFEDRGFRFGDGVFETIAVTSGVPYQFDWHMERLRKGLHAIKISANLHQLHEQSRRLLKENQLKDGVLRIQVTRGIGSRGYLPDSKHPKAGATVVVETMPPPPPAPESASLIISAYEKITAESMPVQYKLCQGLNATLARIEATEKGAFDALLLNRDRMLCETSSGNLFWLKDGVLYTPMLSCGVLEGSMRAAVMRLSPYPVKEVRAVLAELESAQSVFITNALWPLVGINRIEGVAASWQAADTIALKEHIIKDQQNYTEANAIRWQ